jgi:hypothetical protein
VTAPAVYAEGLRVLWSLASRGVSATWDRSGVVLTPPDPTADGVIEKLEAALRPGVDGRSYLQWARERHAPFLREVKAAKPTDVDARPWQRAIEGLESFLFSGWADEALRLGWPEDELFRVPKLWSQINLCGLALLIGDHTFTEVTASRIGIKTSSGAPQGFYRKPPINYALAYRTRLKMAGEDGLREEPRLRALEAVVGMYLINHPGVGVDEAKAAVLAAIKEAAP